jgi:hypothetical protein
MNYEHLTRDKFCKDNIGRAAPLKLSEALLIINIVKRPPRYKRLLSSKFPKIWNLRGLAFRYDFSYLPVQILFSSSG